MDTNIGVLPKISGPIKDDTKPFLLKAHMMALGVTMNSNHGVGRPLISIWHISTTKCVASSVVGL